MVLRCNTVHYDISTNKLLHIVVLCYRVQSVSVSSQAAIDSGQEKIVGVNSHRLGEECGKHDILK